MSVEFDKKGKFHIKGIFVASDRVRNEKVYFVPLSDIVYAFRLVARDYPSKLEFKRAPLSGELKGRAY